MAYIGRTYLNSSEPRSRGAIYTPPEFAHFLASWAIQTPTDVVLDTGVGDGVFVFAAYNRLLQVNATPTAAQRQIWGAEIDTESYERFLVSAQKLGADFPNVCNLDFFDLELPTLSSVIGNPPYVRRSQIANVDHVRQSVLGTNPDIDEDRLSRLSDLYIYFLLRAAGALTSGGRLAVIVADPWMNTEYGVALKDYLQQHFDIEDLISLDRRVFNDAQVKPVLLRAVKKGEAGKSGSVKFVRVMNGLPIGSVGEILKQPGIEHPDIAVFTLQNAELDAHAPWNTYFRASDLYDELASHGSMVPLANIADTRLGVQTLAKEFFVLTPDQVRKAGIEREYLKPLVHSARYLAGPIITNETEPTHYLFYCSRPKEELSGTNALSYIISGENSIVPVRGKDETAIGYHNKRRIQEDSRPYWYDLKTRVDNRGCASILIARLVYRSLPVLWNQAGYVPGELFIEVLPHKALKVDLQVFLALLSSSLVEFILRTHAQVYGGGTFNISPGQIKQVPIPNLAGLSVSGNKKLSSAYQTFLTDTERGRKAIDSALYDELGLARAQCARIEEVLEDLVMVATSSKQRNPINV